MLGSHLSIAGGMVNALHAARRFKMDCVQVFTKNQRQWNGKAITADERDAWLTVLGEMGWDSFEPCAQGPPGASTARVVSHNTYLINMASPDPEMWKKSVAAQRAEIERCEALHIPLCVAHPGAHLGMRSAKETDALSRKQHSRDEIRGLKRIIKALSAIHRALPGYRTVTCLETTVGSGTNLGYSFEQLAYIRENVRQPERVGFCFDTCHITAAGYDMSTPGRALAVMEEWDVVCGIANLRVFHFNDSVGALGSRRDRHAHIGEGCCGGACFRTLLNHPAFAFVPKLLETPKGRHKSHLEWDLINLRRLRRMRKPARHADNAFPQYDGQPRDKGQQLRKAVS